MRGMNDEDKAIRPMFPRLHVNDADKGGPRAPPRNKMALYEHLGTPSQRFSSESASLFSLSPNNGRELVPSFSSSHGVDFQRSTFRSINKSNAASGFAKNHLSNSSWELKTSAQIKCHELRARKSRTDESSNMTQTFTLCAERDSLQFDNFTHFKNFTVMKPKEENDLSVTSLFRGSIHHGKDQGNPPQLGLTFSMNCESHLEKEKKGDQSRIECKRKQSEESLKPFRRYQDGSGRAYIVSSTRGVLLGDAVQSASDKVKGHEVVKQPRPSSSWEDESQSAGAFNSLYNSNAGLNQDKPVRGEHPKAEPAKNVVEQNVLKIESDSLPNPSPVDDGRSPNRSENGKYKRHESLELGVVERCDDVSKNSMLDCPDITPDDVVGAIGETRFWEFRKAILDQQRLFAGQVFELHRLVKVQKLIAGSPHLLLEEKHYMKKPLLNVSLENKVPLQHPVEQSTVALKPKDCSLKLQTRNGYVDENGIGKLPLPFMNNDTSKGFLAQQLNSSVLPAYMSSDGKPSRLFFLPTEKQWTVPVLSPSEGLVYKPYKGPCPPATGFVAPIYGGYGHMTVSPSSGDFFNAAYSSPRPHQQGIGVLPGPAPFGQTYFPPYGVPVINPSVVVEQMSPVMGPKLSDNQLAIGNINFTFLQQNSCNISSQRSQTVFCQVDKFQDFKESEVQESTMNSSTESLKGDALPLFPTEPAVRAFDQDAQGKEQQTPVIKVVPRDARSATESVARIFKCLQEERQRCA